MSISCGKRMNERTNKGNKNLNIKLGFVCFLFLKFAFFFIHFCYYILRYLGSVKLINMHFKYLFIREIKIFIGWDPPI